MYTPNDEKIRSIIIFQPHWIASQTMIRLPKAFIIHNNYIESRLHLARQKNVFWENKIQVQRTILKVGGVFTNQSNIFEGAFLKK